jgi:hypothetical protein
MGHQCRRREVSAMKVILSILLLATSLPAQPWSDVTLSQPVRGAAAAIPGFESLLVNTNNSVFGNTSFSVLVTNAVSSGKWIALFISTATTNGGITAVSDARTNSYTYRARAKSTGSGGRPFIECYTSQLSTGLSVGDQITVTYASSGNLFYLAMGCSFTNVTGFDMFATNSATFGAGGGTATATGYSTNAPTAFAGVLIHDGTTDGISGNNWTLVNSRAYSGITGNAYLYSTNRTSAETITLNATGSSAVAFESWAVLFIGLY